MKNIFIYFNYSLHTTISMTILITKEMYNPCARSFAVSVLFVHAYHLIISPTLFDSWVCLNAFTGTQNPYNMVI